jgi:hypothetical protein
MMALSHSLFNRTVMVQSGRLIGDVFASVGVALAIAGPALVGVQYFIWLRTGVWHRINIRMIFHAMSVSTPQALEPMLNLPLWLAMFAVGLVFIWIAAEIYERHTRSLREKE